MAIKHRGVIFDLDGTLADTLEDIAVSMNKSLLQHGFQQLETAAFREKIGWGMRRLAYLCLPEDSRQDAVVDKVAADAVRFYTDVPLACTKPYLGIPELIAELGRKKIKTAVLTNKPDATARLVVGGLFPAGSFGVVRGETDDRPRKPDPGCVWELLVEMDLTPADVIFAGDSEIDIETACSSGCFALGVSWGYRSAEAIAKAGARRIIDRPEELLGLLGR